MVLGRVFLVFHGSRLVFHVARWVFMVLGCFSQFQVSFCGFYGSRLVFHFSC